MTDLWVDERGNARCDPATCGICADQRRWGTVNSAAINLDALRALLREDCGRDITVVDRG